MELLRRSATQLSMRASNCVLSNYIQFPFIRIHGGLTQLEHCVSAHGAVSSRHEITIQAREVTVRQLVVGSEGPNCKTFLLSFCTPGSFIMIDDAGYHTARVASDSLSKTYAVFRRELRRWRSRAGATARRGGGGGGGG